MTDRHASLDVAASVTDATPSQVVAGRFRNQAPRHALGLARTVAVFWKFATGRKPVGTVPGGPIAVRPLARADLLAAPDMSLWRLGHSTVLLKLSGGFWLTDPVFSERASPVRFAGPRRFHAPPIAIDDLPPITGVVLSHDHYDHLDHAAIRALAPRVAHFVAPLGVGDRLIAWGVPAHKVQQLDWWQGTAIAGVELVATPAQHFSGRGLSDGNRTLWASWVLRAQGRRVFFSGDSGYFSGFRAIGERYGPFDLTLMETGAYNEDWPDVHMQPEQSLQAHLDVRGRQLLPIHNGTFDLSMHPWNEPFDRIEALAGQQGIPLLTPAMGERVDIAAPAATPRWWRAGAASAPTPAPAPAPGAAPAG